jgi:hypothetical protein
VKTELSLNSINERRISKEEQKRTCRLRCLQRHTRDALSDSMIQDAAYELGTYRIYKQVKDCSLFNLIRGQDVTDRVEF